MAKKLFFQENGKPVIGPFDGTLNFYRNNWLTTVAEDTFVITNGILTETGPIELTINGILYDESYFTRDVANNQIVLNAEVPSGTSLYLKIFNF